MDLYQRTKESINELKNTQKKIIDNSNKILISGIKDINKELPKFRKGLEQVQKFQEEKMSVGIDGVAKQRKSLLKSLRALGDFLSVAKRELDERLPEESIILDEVKLWGYEDFKEWLRNFSKLINNVDKERSKADRIMGLDFALKKRPATSPFSKLKDARNLLRDLFQKEFTIVKIIEDLEKLHSEIISLEERHANEAEKLHELSEKITNLKTRIKEMELNYNKQENEGEIKKLRESKVKFKEAELEIGHLINPFKKIFRQYTRMDGANAYVLGNIHSYEDHPIDTFLQDYETEPKFHQLKEIMNEIINNASKIDLKANLKNRCIQLVQRIDSGKISKFKDDYINLKAEVTRLSQNQVVEKALEDLEKLHTQINGLKKEVEDLEKEVENSQLEQKELEEQLISREKRFNEAFKLGIEFVPDQ